jgi:polyisoprenoid-binding protein YceI
MPVTLRTKLLAALLLAVSVLALLIDPAAGLAQSAPKWIVDPTGSELGFESSAEGSAFDAHFQTWDADIRFDPNQLAQSKVVVTVDTASALTGDSSRDQTARGEDWFSSMMFPKATFTSTSFKDLGAGKYEADGDLVIRGVSQPVSLPFTLSISGDQATMTGETDINRSLFGVGQGEYGSADVVPLSVKVKVSIKARRAG